MAIAHVESAGAIAGYGSASVSVAYPTNVAVGDLISVVGWRYCDVTDAFVTGDCTSSGGASVDTIVLDASLNLDMGGGAGFAQIGIWSCLVTGAGSLTMQVAGGAVNATAIAISRYTGNFDSSRVEDTSTNSTATDDTTPGHSGDATSAGAALFIGGIAVGNAGVTLTVTPDGAFTQIYENQDGSSSQIGSAIYQLVGTGTTDRAEWTLQTGGNTGHVAAVVVYKEAGPTGPTIDTHPSNATAYSGQTAQFTVSATTSGGTLTYQWQRSTDGGVSYSNVSGGSGGTTATYTTPTLGFTENGYFYRCAVTDDNGTKNSNGARLTLIPMSPISWLRA